MEPISDLGGRLVVFRAAAGLSQKELALRSGVSKAHIQKLEAGKSNPSVLTLNLILKACGSTLGEFFNDALPPSYRKPGEWEAHLHLHNLLRLRDPSLTIGITAALKVLHEAFHKKKTLSQ